MRRYAPAVSPRVGGTALLVLAAVLFGTLSVVSRTSAELGLGTLAFVTWRAALGGAALAIALGAAAAAGRTRLVTFGSVPTSARMALVVGIVCATVVNLGIFAAFQRISVALTLIIFYTYPALVTIAAVALHGEPLDRRRVSALGLASVGLLLVVLAPALARGGLTFEPIGLGLAALAAIAQTVYVLVGARGFPAVPSGQAVSVILLGSGAVSLVLLVVLGEPGPLRAPFDEPRLWPWVAAASITGAAVPTTALLVGIRLVGPTQAAILMTLEPVVGALVAALFLGEQPIALQVVGGAAVLAAGALLQLPSRKPASAGTREPTVEPAHEVR